MIINMKSNNDSGIQSTKKKLKRIKYFKNKLLPQGILFLQKICFTESNERSWRDKLNATFYLSYGLSNSCRVLIDFLA